MFFPPVFYCERGGGGKGGKGRRREKRKDKKKRKERGEKEEEKRTIDGWMDGWIGLRSYS